MMMDTAEQRYLRDSQFRLLVDQMELAIRRTQYTPSELREAAMLAAIHYEMRQISHHMFVPEGQ